MASKRLLIALAHPDDESFGSGGLIAKYVSEGVQVDYICATRGNRGTVAPEFLEKHGSIDAVRDAELACAAQVLGFHQVYKLGYGDSNMMGHPDNQDPTCLWQADESEVAGKIVQIIRQTQPQVLLTFDPYGGYGHPDHIFIHRATTRAFFAASDPAQYPEMGAPYAPQKLYYSAFPRRLLQLLIFMMRLRRQDPRKAGVNHDLDFIKVLENAREVHTQVNIKAWMEVWDQASRCHASQMSPRTTMPRWMRWFLGSRQGFVRAHPHYHPGDRTEHDLFEGVTL
jgi:LmbE family N-acetylglucosaminyl deacetylase